MLNITINGVDLVRKSLGRIVPQSEESVLALAEKVHEYGRVGADRHTKTGALKDSLGHGPTKIAAGWRVGHDLQRAPHAVFVHWGTRPHIIKPKDKKALRWAGGGKFFFSKLVHHPGYKGDPYLINAAVRGLLEFQGIIDKTIKG